MRHSSPLRVLLPLFTLGLVSFGGVSAAQPTISDIQSFDQAVQDAPLDSDCNAELCSGTAVKKVNAMLEHTKKLLKAIVDFMSHEDTHKAHGASF